MYDISKLPVNYHYLVKNIHEKELSDAVAGCCVNCGKVILIIKTNRDIHVAMIPVTLYTLCTKKLIT